MNRTMRHRQRERRQLPFRWPDPPLHVVLVEPSIPPNTGNVARLCAGVGAVLDLIEPLGFDLSEKRLRRAGLDYWDAVDVRLHPNFDAFLSATPSGRRFFFSTAGERPYYDVDYRPGDALVFGNETVGLSDELLAAQPPDRVCNLPIRLDRIRSVNLSNCAAVALYEALRQIHLSTETSKT